MSIMSSVHVERPADSDFPACLPLLSALHNGDIGKAMKDCFAEFCCGPNAVALVARQGGEVVGMIAGTEVPDLDFEAHVATVNAIIVSRRSRGRGIGLALMDGFMQWARERGCVAVLQRTRRQGARRFLRSVGFERSTSSSGFVKYLVSPEQLGKPHGAEGCYARTRLSAGGQDGQP